MCGAGLRFGPLSTITDEKHNLVVLDPAVLELLWCRCQQLLLDLAANEEQIRQLQQRLADYDDAFAKVLTDMRCVAAISCGSGGWFLG